MKTRKKVVIILALIIGVVLVVGGFFIYTYLIPRPEFVVDNPSLPAFETQPNSTEQPIESTLPYATIFYDKYNYSSNFIHIKIETISATKANKSPVKYYLADVQLSDSKFLLTAFAKNQFGSNVVQEFDKIASNNKAIFAVNGDYYNWAGRSRGKLIRNGIIYRNVAWDEMVAFYKNGDMKTFNEKDVELEQLKNDGVFQSFSFGPSLVKNGQIVTDFSHYQIPIHTLGAQRYEVRSENPRTGVGIIAPNHFLFIVVDGRQPGISDGMTLDEFAKVFYDKGCKEAYNLDGGASSTMYFMGKIINKPAIDGNPSRDLSDIIFIKE